MVKLKGFGVIVNLEVIVLGFASAAFELQWQMNRQTLLVLYYIYRSSVLLTCYIRKIINYFNISLHFKQEFKLNHIICFLASKYD